MTTWIRGADSKKAVYRCECGAEFVAFKSNVSRGHTRSCGCVRRRVTRERSFKHGGKSGGVRTRSYVAWVNMRARCENAARPDFMNYGARGITVCRRWMKFENFLADMGEPPENTSLDRVDSAEGYSPSNCRWASRKVQAQNKRSVVLYEHEGRNMCLSDWAVESGIGRLTLRYRLKAGWPIAQALTQKPQRLTLDNCPPTIAVPGL